MSNRSASLPVLSMSLVVTGNIVGAGILALPVNLGPSGFWPALLGTVIMWILMCWTALVLARQKSLAESDTADFPSFFQKELGNGAKWVTIVANLIILYGVLVAYLTGVTTIMSSLIDSSIPNWVYLLSYFIFAAALTSFGLAVMRKGNAVLMVILYSTFVAMVVMAVSHVQPERFKEMNWIFLPAGMPVLVTAFHFHNIIPTVCKELKQDQGAITKAIVWGTFIGFVMNMIWIFVAMGGIPMRGSENSILFAFQNNLPATIPLARILHSKVFTEIGVIFAFVAMTTSFMANGTALQSFVRDLTASYLKNSSTGLVWVLAFIPPLVVALVYPDIFLVAMNIVGGVGEDVIFGILPGIILVKYSRPGTWTRWGGYLLIVFFGMILAYEFAQEFGLVHISPDTEYWNANHALNGTM